MVGRNNTQTFCAKNLSGLFLAISRVSPVFSWAFSQFQPISVTLSQFQSFSITFSHFQSLWLNQLRTSLLTTGRWGKIRLKTILDCDMARSTQKYDFILGNGRNTVSRVLFRRRELTEPHWVLGQTRWVLRKTRWVRFFTQIIGWEELTEFAPRNSVSPEKLTKFGVWNRTLWNPFGLKVSSMLRERPKRDDDSWELHLVDHQMPYLKPLFHFTIQKRDNTRGL